MMKAVALDRRREANASWFAAEATASPVLCQRMAQRFTAGGGCSQFGRSPAAQSDAAMSPSNSSIP